MPLVFGCIAPHGDVIPDASGVSRSPATAAAMLELGRRMESARPESVVVITPHGIRADGAITISLSERAAGTLELPNSPDGSNDHADPIKVDLPVDRALAGALHSAAAAEGISIVPVHYGATSGPEDCYPLDWGAVVPLWFLGARFASSPHVAIAVPSRLLPLDAFVRFGRALVDAAFGMERRVALIASADLAHAHAADGPYGFDPAAARFDAWLADAVKEGDLSRLEHPDMDLVAAAKPDGLWQILVLAGALQRIPMHGEFLSYECPTYYGMLCAAYEPLD
jgi:aromatic ring-opening dioxygenase LigB subunit